MKPISKLASDYVRKKFSMSRQYDSKYKFMSLYNMISDRLYIEEEATRNHIGL